MVLRPSVITISMVIAPLLGCSKASSSTADEAAPKTAVAEPLAQDHTNHQHAAAQVTESGAQISAITVNENGFAPNHVEVKRGSKATLRFTRTSDKTCATAVAFPELRLNKPLPLNQPVDIDIPSDQPRTLTFQCGMGMYQSKVVVL